MGVPLSPASTTAMDDFCGSPFWNVTLTWYSDSPDFTPCFEHTALVWTPCVFLWVFTPVEFHFIRNGPTNRRRLYIGHLVRSKLVISAFLAILSSIDLGLSIWEYVKHEGHVYPVDFFTPSFKFVTFLLTSLLLLLNRRAGIPTSGLLTLFWFFLLIFGIPQYRTDLLQEFYETTNKMDQVRFITYMIYLPLVALSFILSCFADPITVEGYDSIQKPCPEQFSSFLSRILLAWFDPVIWGGLRKPLEYDDLWDLNTAETCHNAVGKFNIHFDRSLQAAAKKSTEEARKVASILPALLKSFGGFFFFTASVELVGELLLFVNPHILKLLIAFTDSHDPLWKGLLYAVAMFASEIVQMFLHSQSLYYMTLIGMRIRAALVSAVYRKSLRVSNAALTETSTGEIVNLMSVDAQAFLDVGYFTTLWTAPIQICVALYLLWNTLGVALVGGIVVMILLVPLNSYISNKLETFQTQQLETKDERVKIMNEILNGIKVLKLYAWELPFAKRVDTIRAKEMKLLKKEAFLEAGTSFAFDVAPLLVTLVSFSTYVLIDKENILDAEKAFFTLSLFSILEGPLRSLPSVVIAAVQASVSVKRLNKFLNAAELDTETVSHNNEEETALVIENGTFTWGPNEPPALHDISLKVQSGQLVAVVGRVGAGKSSLLAALLGETEKLAGRVNTKGSIAYVPQQAWIQNATLRDNILFGRAMDEEKYERVLHDCALKSDLAMLPAGDATEIGEKGINLSGGQKQRVSLARALYRDADVLLLDDPLSAVDSHVGKHIYEHALGPNSRLKNKTRILVTHGVAFLHEADLVVVLVDGQVRESGTYQELLDSQGTLFKLLSREGGDASAQSGELEGTEEQTPFRTLFSRTSSRDSTSIRRRRLPSVQIGEEGEDIDNDDSDDDRGDDGDRARLISDEEAQTGSVKASVYAHYFRSLGIKTISVALFLNIILEGFGVGSSLWLTEWTEDSDMKNPNSSRFIPKRNMYLGVYAALEMSQVFLEIIVSFIFAIGCLNASTVLYTKMFDRVLRSPMSFFDTTPMGRILNRFSRDVFLVDNVLPYYLITTLSLLFSVFRTLFVISYSTPIVMAVLVPISIVYFFLQRYFVAVSRQLKRLSGITRSPVYSHFSETLSGMASIRAYGEMERFVKDAELKADNNQKCYFPIIVSERWVGLRLELLSAAVVFFASLFAVLGRRKITSALVGLSVSYALKITQSLSYLVEYTADVENTIVAVERIKEYTETAQEAEWHLRFEPVNQAWPSKGGIKFENFSLRYRDGLDLVLKEVNFTVNGGEKVGIVGRTGAGKSSLTQAVFRIVEAACGRILIDGVDVSQMGLQTLRSRITIIPQDPWLFSGSIRGNLDPHQALSDDELWRALENAHLKEVVQGFLEGLDHEVKEGGVNLSVGQRQLVCLARALIRKTKILVFDEATAAVDMETESLIQNTIKTEFKDNTILTIAHRINTILDCDRVLVMHEGKIAEFESPQKLLQNKRSIFYGLAKDAGLAT